MYRLTSGHFVYPDGPSGKTPTYHPGLLSRGHEVLKERAGREGVPEVTSTRRSSSPSGSRSTTASTWASTTYWENIPLWNTIDEAMKPYRVHRGASPRMIGYAGPANAEGQRGPLQVRDHRHVRQGRPGHEGGGRGEVGGARHKRVYEAEAARRPGSAPGSGRARVQSPRLRTPLGCQGAPAQVLGRGLRAGDVRRLAGHEGAPLARGRHGAAGGRPRPRHGGRQPASRPTASGNQRSHLMLLLPPIARCIPVTSWSFRRPAVASLEDGGHCRPSAPLMPTPGRKSRWCGAPANIGRKPGRSGRGLERR